MSDQQPAGIQVSGTALVWAITAMFVATVGGVVVLAVGVPESANPAALIGQLLGAFGLLVASLGSLFGLSRVRKQVHEVAADVKEVKQQTNGSQDARILRMATAAAITAVDQHIKREEQGR